MHATKEQAVTKSIKSVEESKAAFKRKASFDDDNFDLSDAFGDDDNDLIDVAPVKPVKATHKKVAKVVEKSSLVKAKPIAAPKSIPKASHTTPIIKSEALPAAKSVNSSNANLTSDDILKSIPDAILPEVDTSKKFNYFALKAAKDSGAQPSGDIIIPDARENCFAGMTFVFTGNLPRLSREEGQDIVKKYGGKVTTSPSSKTTCVVLGAEAGPSKIEKIRKFGIKAIDEDGFLQLLSKMPADGGSGVAAQKAVLKQKEEQKKVEIAVKEMSKNIGTNNNNKTDNSNSELWTTKYAPTELSHICGNKGLVEKLGRWLRNWRANAKKGFKSPSTDGSGIYRAVIISGPPGIGKTTTAHLVAKLNGFDVIESNASDTRSKNMLINKVMGSTKNTSLSPLSNEAKAKGLPTAVKSAFTRNYNKASHPVPFMKSSSMFSAKATAAAMPTEVPDLEETVGEEIPVAEDDAEDKEKDEEEDLSKDKYIKVSKPKAPAKRGAKKAATTTGGSSKGKTVRGKGRASTR
ncbi:hypothetical protein D0Z03_000594 [Geotrichum reessii]|nr:hypothetical protein D0Z03_000594 [Galactomyces reessii]